MPNAPGWDSELSLNKFIRSPCCTQNVARANWLRLSFSSKMDWKMRHNARTMDVRHLMDISRGIHFHGDKCDEENNSEPFFLAMKVKAAMQNATISKRSYFTYPWSFAFFLNLCKKLKNEVQWNEKKNTHINKWRTQWMLDRIRHIMQRYVSVGIEEGVNLRSVNNGMSRSTW